jgi:hypothetical protein
MTDEATAAQKLDFLVGETRKALAIFARMNLTNYFRRNREGDELALAIEQASVHLESALHVLGKPSLKETPSPLSPQQIHDRDVGKIVEQIVMPTLKAGGQMTNVLVLLESVVLGVCLFIVKLGGDEIVLDQVIASAKARLAKARLGDIDVAGRA